MARLWLACACQLSACWLEGRLISFTPPCPPLKEGGNNSDFKNGNKNRTRTRSTTRTTRKKKRKRMSES
jgi:hypothetical protein